MKKCMKRVQKAMVTFKYLGLTYEIFYFASSPLLHRTKYI